jgi:hypothetical protein
MDNGDLFCDLGVRILLKEKPGVSDPKARFSDSFNIVKETLTRIGIASRKEKTLYQTAHILHKRGQYAILHFKELFKLDGKPTEITDDDIARRNLIVKLLSEWKLITIVDEKKAEPQALLSQVKIVSFEDKRNWKLVPKYSIGATRQVQQAVISVGLP